jgi:toxin secretion/phage lysis holin|nr:MAG TPA: holin [Caudoviricetes sp.]
MKEWICAAAGTVGGLIAGLFGGWDAAIRALLVFMAIDYLMGLACAGIFKKSPKTESGGLQSKVGWKGLCRKVATLALVVVAVQVDAVLHTSYVRDGVCIAFMVNELISMVENVGLMGVQFPEPLRKAIDLLQKKEEKK